MTKERTFRERATRGFAWNYLYKLTEFGLMNLYTILVVRHFGPQISAPYAVFTALCTTISIISAFAVDGVLLRFIQRVSTNEHSGPGDFTDLSSLGIRHFLKTLFAVRILVVTIVSIFIFILLFFLPEAFPSFADSLGSVREFSPYLIIFLYAQAIIAFCTFSLIGLLETKRVFFASLLSRSLLLGGGLIFLFRDLLSLPYAVGLFTASAVINAFYLLFALNAEIRKSYRREGQKRYPFVSVMKELGKLITGGRRIRLFLATPLMLYGITTWGSDILSTVLGRQPDILMMRAMLGEFSPQIGYYLAASIVLLVTEYVFLFGLGGTLVSIFSKLAHDDEQQEERKSYPRLARARREIAGFQNVVLLPLCAYMMIFAPEVMRSVYGSKYDAAIPMIRIGLSALALAVGMFGGGMQATTLVAIGKERLVFRNRLFWGATNLTVNFFLIRFYGGLGAIIGSQFSNAFTCGTESYYSRKLVGSSLDLLGTIRIILISGSAAIAGYFVVQMIGSEISPIVASILGAIVAGLAVTILYILFKVPEAKRVWHQLRGLLLGKNPAALTSE
ncbi:MAG: oligosaccharide flippase family protein [Bacteroidota bacterium]|nr:oligosaccharide flippase family protein [Bacteroidota bacterium]MDP4229044.1 oligosaccharide flippase family protein [Bacteroidota bacterium]MDP4235435.1 oligosaccharide flippase family protein [Bacteroidota bacterium]